MPAPTCIEAGLISLSSENMNNSTASVWAGRNSLEPAGCLSKAANQQYEILVAKAQPYYPVSNPALRMMIDKEFAIKTTIVCPISGKPKQMWSV